MIPVTHHTHKPEESTAARKQSVCFLGKPPYGKHLKTKTTHQRPIVGQ
jgi:hypothetical protein